MKEPPPESVEQTETQSRSPTLTAAMGQMAEVIGRSLAMAWGTLHDKGHFGAVRADMHDVHEPGSGSTSRTTIGT